MGMRKHIDENNDEEIYYPKEKTTELTDDEIYGGYSSYHVMKHWPVPDSFFDELPKYGSPGAFWKDRGDRYNCGIDFFASPGASVLAVESGQVVDKGIFTSPTQNRYWYSTRYVIIKTSENILYKYAGLSQVLAHVGDYVESGQLIGLVGMLINKDKITPQTPSYVRELISHNFLSMLHLEMYKAPISEVKPYSGGNFFGKNKPDSIIDPNTYLYDVKKDKK
jgi:murein DD-endopeptidase MepM/ murein hydrolase activator NlpD